MRGCHRKLTDEERHKISDASLGVPSPNRGQYPRTEAYRENLRQKYAERVASGWQPKQKTAPTFNRSVWTRAVKNQGNHTCAYCGLHSKKSLHAHHIIAKSLWPAGAELVNNGIVLCKPCHIAEHNLNGLIGPKS